MQDFFQSYTEPGADEAKYVRLLREVRGATSLAGKCSLLACTHAHSRDHCLTAEVRQAAISQGRLHACMQQPRLYNFWGPWHD